MTIYTKVVRPIIRLSFFCRAYALNRTVCVKEGCGKVFRLEYELFGESVEVTLVRHVHDDWAV